MSFKVVIPARFASTRLPGKPLADIAGKPMVVRVAELAARSGADEILIATDDPRVHDVCLAHGLSVAMTAADHPSGTDRIAEVAAQRRWDDGQIVVNVQGDEPLLDPALISRIAQALREDPDASIATVAHALDRAEDFFNPNVVKVVVDARGRALYFSRAPIPWARDAFAVNRTRLPEGFVARRHVGLYAYRVAFLRCYGELTPAPEERQEALEQLRALWHGHAIRVVDCADAPPPGVDTAEDLERVRRVFDRSADRR